MKCRVATQKQIRKFNKEYVYHLSPITILAILWTSESKLKFGYEKMRKMADRVNYRYDDIAQGYISFDDLKECLKEDDGVDVPFSLDKQECHTLDDARRIAEYTQKAFATVVFASVLCDKFHFGSVKTQQSIKWLCEVFDEIKGNREAIKRLQERYYTDFLIQVR